MTLYSPKDFVVPAGSQLRVKTGLKILVPKECYGQIETYPSHIDAQILVEGQMIRENYLEEVEIQLSNNG